MLAYLCMMLHKDPMFCVQTRSYAPVTIEPSRDYLTAYAEKEVRERLQRATPAADRYIVAAPTEPAETTRVVQKWVKFFVQALRHLFTLSVAIWYSECTC